MLSPHIQLIVLPHCDPGIPLLGVHQLCGYATSLGVKADVVDLSVALKNAKRECLEDADFLNQGTYWKSIARARESFRLNYKREAPYADPSWDSANIQSFRWNYFSEQRLFIERYSSDENVTAFYDRVLPPERDPDVYFISVMFPSQFLDALLIASYIRRRRGNAKIVIGGGLLTSLIVSPDDIEGQLADLFDAVSIGEGELLVYAMTQASLSEIIDRYGEKRAGKRAALLLSKSLMEHVNRSITVPSPVYDSDVGGRYLTHRIVLPYRIAASCYWNRCSFCTDWMYRSFLKPVSLVEHVRRLKEISERSGGVIFQDSALHPRILYDLSCGIKEQIPGGSFYWGINARFDPLLTRTVLAKMAEAGCSFIRFGLESGSPMILDSMAKGIDLEIARRILKDTRELGILTHAYCIVGYNGERDEDRACTRSFLLDNESYPDSFSISQYMAYFASRSNYQGVVARNNKECWQLSEPHEDDPMLTDFIQETELSFSRRHPLYRTLASPAHTIGSYDFIREWKK